MIATFISVFFATIVALVSGYFRGFVDGILSRTMDLIWAFPVILLGIALGTALAVGGLKIGSFTVNGDSLWIPILIIGVVYIPYMAKPLRGAGAELAGEGVRRGLASPRARDRCGSCSGSSCPTSSRRIIVFFTAQVANTSCSSRPSHSSGPACRPPNPSWGTMIADGIRLIRRRTSRSIPGVMIVLTVLALNVFGDGLRDALDPRAKMQASSTDGHRFIVRRLIGMVAVLFAISILTFLIFK